MHMEYGEEQAPHGLWSSAGLKMLIRPTFSAGDFNQ